MVEKNSYCRQKLFLPAKITFTRTVFSVERAAVCTKWKNLPTLMWSLVSVLRICARNLIFAVIKQRLLTKKKLMAVLFIQCTVHLTALNARSTNKFGTKVEGDDGSPPPVPPVWRLGAKPLVRGGQSSLKSIRYEMLV